MPATGKQLAALRAQLAGRLDGHEELFAQLDWRADGTAYAALLDVALSGAVDRRFNGQPGAGDTVAYVVDVCARTKSAARLPGPEVAGRLIGKPGRGIDDLDPRAAVMAKQWPSGRAGGRGYYDAGPDQFLQEGCGLAGKQLGCRQ